MLPSPDVSTPAPPIAGRYVVGATLGRGGMGEVFLAHDLEANRPVALKLVRADLNGHPDFSTRFEAEGNVARALRHPNVCAVHAIGRDGSRPFIAMEYVQGDTLDELVSRGRLQTGAVIDIGRQLASALDAARRLRVVHRDLNSRNIVVTTAGLVKILDFGLACVEPETFDGERAGADGGLLAGTAEYMSPEQALGRRVDHRSDLFSLGVVLYELLTGATPFASTSPMEVLWKILNTEAAAIPADEPRARALVAVVSRLLQKDRGARYQTAAEVHDDLVAAARVADPRRVSTVALLRPLAGVAAGLVLTFGGLVPGTAWLCNSGVGAWHAAPENRTSIWIGAPGGTLSPLIAAIPEAGDVRIGNTARVVYAAAGGLWMVESGLDTARLVIADGSHPALASDGQTVVFRRTGRNAGLYRVDVTGAHLKRLVSGEVANPTIAADGRIAMFERADTASRGLWAVDVSGGPPRRLISRMPGARPLLSPDGRRIAFTADAGVILCTLPACADERQLPIAEALAWTPDGRGLAYPGADSANVWILPVGGGPARQLTHFSDRAITSVAWSPDGRRVAVTRVVTFARPASWPRADGRLW